MPMKMLSRLLGINDASRMEVTWLIRTREVPFDSPLAASLPRLMTASHQQIIRSYRNLYRHGLHAVQYSSPARYTVKALIENAYRTGRLADFDIQKVNNTLTFLHGAAKEKGLEHRILKNLLHTWWWESKNKRHYRDQSMKIAQKKHQMSKSTVDHFEITLKMLNESMRMCLPTSLIMVDKLPEDDAWLHDGSDSEEFFEHPLEEHKSDQ